MIESELLVLFCCFVWREDNTGSEKIHPLLFYTSLSTAVALSLSHAAAAAGGSSDPPPVSERHVAQRRIWLSCTHSLLAWHASSR